MGNRGSTASRRLKIRSRAELRRVERSEESRRTEENVRQSASKLLKTSNFTSGDAAEVKQAKPNVVPEDFTTIKGVVASKRVKATDTGTGEAYWYESSSSATSVKYSSSEPSYPVIDNEAARAIRLARRNRRKRQVSENPKALAERELERSNWIRGYTPNKHGTMVHDTVYDADDREAIADALDWMKFEQPISYRNILDGKYEAKGWWAKQLADKHKHTYSLPDRPFYLLEHFPELVEVPKTRQDHLKNYYAFRRRLQGGGRPPQTESHYWKTFKASFMAFLNRMKAPKSPTSKFLKRKKNRLTRFSEIFHSQPVGVQNPKKPHGQIDRSHEPR